MAIGDDAAAAGMDLVAGSVLANTIDTELNKTRDYIAQRTDTIVPVAKGGTGANTASGARSNIGAASASHTHAASAITTSGSNVQADINFLNSIKYDKSGGTVSGNATFSAGIFNNPGAATFSWTVAYFNGDNSLRKGSSSERYKEDIQAVDPAALGDIFPQLHTFYMKEDPSHQERVGYIAERLNESDDLRRFVVYARDEVRDDDGNVVANPLSRDENGAPIPESIDFITMLMAQVAQLHSRDVAREARFAELEARVEALGG